MKTIALIKGEADIKSFHDFKKIFKDSTKVIKNIKDEIGKIDLTF